MPLRPDPDEIKKLPRARRKSGSKKPKGDSLLARAVKLIIGK